jgi:hypothetical protein
VRRPAPVEPTPESSRAAALALLRHGFADYADTLLRLHPGDAPAVAALANIGAGDVAEAIRALEAAAPALSAAAA